MFDTELEAADLGGDADDGLPADLDLIPPGLLLAVMVSSVDRDRLSGYDRVLLLKARARLRAWLDAEYYADIHAISGEMAELAEELTDRRFEQVEETFDATACEISAALTLTRRASEVEVDLAFQLRERLPGVWAALSDGIIDLARARVLADQTCHLPRDLAGEVCDTVLSERPQTTGQLKARLQRLIISVDPDSARERYEEKLSERKVYCVPTEAGTANLCGTDLPAADANAAMRRINRLAGKAKKKGDTRGIDEIRADVYLGLLTGRGQQSNSGESADGNDLGVVDMRAELTTLLGLDDQPGEIPGWGPVIADVARQVVDRSYGAEWRAVITGHDQILDVVTTRRRPTRAQRRHVESRHPQCVYPTCRMPTRDCDLDHETPWTETQQTPTRGLEPLCRYHHRQKHHRWKLVQIRPGVYQWTSPLGHTYIVEQDPP